MSEKISRIYDKAYKTLLAIAVLLLVLGVFYLSSFAIQNGDVIAKDISLTGGTSVQVNSDVNIPELKTALREQFDDFSVRQISNILTGEQIAFVVETSAEPEEIVTFLEDYLGFELTQDNHSIEFTGSSVSNAFYRQLKFAVLTAFIFMGAVVFSIFCLSNWKLKLLVWILSLFPSFLFFSNLIGIDLAFTLSYITIFIDILIYLKFSIPSIAVIFSAFSDIVLTISVINLLGIKVSTAGIVAFLMLIGYSVDTDILLTTRVLKTRDSPINERIFGAFKTGMTMTLTSLSVIIVGLVLTASLSKVFSQIFTILTIGLLFDMMNTWFANASMLKWYVEKKD